MEDATAFKIYVEQLRNGHSREVNEAFPPDFLEIQEENLSFTDKVTVEGEAYLAGDTLVLHFVIAAHGIIPCSICNEPVKVEISISDFYHAEPLAEIKTGVFNFRDIMREAILLETPVFAECEGKCPKRKEIKKYLKQNTKEQKEGYRPFADL